MQLDIAVLADAANVSQEGKLNIIGIFRNIRTPSVPLTHPFMVLVLGFIAEADEKGQTHTLGVRLIDQDGAAIGQFPEIQVNIAADAPGSEVPIPIVLNLPLLGLPRWGEYRFDILLNGAHIRGLPLEVTRFPP